MGIYADGTVTGRKLYYGGIKIRKMALGNRKVYSSGNMATYHVDTGISYTEEVEEGASCLSPGTFTPEKEGWEFAGWRQDTAAEGEVLGSLVMGEDPITLYALFKQDVILTTVANGITARETRQRLYNNGNLANPSFTVTDPVLAGATFKGWSSGAGSTDITSPTIINLELEESATRWAVFQYADSVVGNINLSYYTNNPGRHYAWTRMDGTSMGNNFNVFGLTFDCEKYAAISIAGLHADCVANFKDHSAWIDLVCGGTTKRLVSSGTDWDAFDGTFTIPFVQTSGTTSCILSAGASGSTTVGMDFRPQNPPYFYTITKFGRTVVG